MEIDLTPRLSKKSYGGDGGAYYAWSAEELPMLRVASIGAAKILLEKRGLAPPSYSDSAKVAYVLQGETLFDSFAHSLSIVSPFCFRSRDFGFGFEVAISSVDRVI